MEAITSLSLPSSAQPVGRLMDDDIHTQTTYSQRVPAPANIPLATGGASERPPFLCRTAQEIVRTVRRSERPRASTGKPGAQVHGKTAARTCSFVWGTSVAQHGTNMLGPVSEEDNG